MQKIAARANNFLVLVNMIHLTHGELGYDNFLVLVNMIHLTHG